MQSGVNAIKRIRRHRDVMSVICFLYFVEFARDFSTVFEEIKHLRSRAPEKYFTRLLKQIKHKYC